MSRLQRGLLACVLVLTAMAAAGRYTSGVSHLAAFVAAALALAGLAWTVSFATEQIGMRFGPAATGVLQSTIGNLPEFFVVLFALQAHDRTVAETALIGSILVNALLVLGAV
ncbi:MAG: sodium:proton exchanger, partial [Actinomycetota bacterium]|nr:sodium:proton exchanger [Actinomycetota bacterium]